MSTSTSKRRRGWLLVLCAVAMLSVGFAFTYHEFVIDVVDGRFVCEAYDMPLSDIDRPIAVGMLDDMVEVRVATSEGEVALTLGQGTFALTERAMPYVRAMEEAFPVEAEEAEVCEVCGQSTAIGRHFLLECGHFGCLVTADHPQVCTACGKYMCSTESHLPCEHCGVAMCVHVKLECEYYRNPAPTPYATKEGTTTSYRNLQAGYVEGSADNKKPSDWTPAEDYYKAHATPSPAPTEGLP